jgi:hypothetical protein
VKNIYKLYLNPLPLKMHKLANFMHKLANLGGGAKEPLWFSARGKLLFFEERGGCG